MARGRACAGARPPSSPGIGRAPLAAPGPYSRPRAPGVLNPLPRLALVSLRGPTDGQTGRRRPAAGARSSRRAGRGLRRGARQGVATGRRGRDGRRAGARRRRACGGRGAGRPRLRVSPRRVAPGRGDLEWGRVDWRLWRRRIPGDREDESWRGIANWQALRRVG